jgi:[NiFe] hydrogenase assembly HybE family chaperone
VATRLRRPAIVPQLPAPAQPHAEDPSAAVVAHFETVWQTAMHDLPFVNPALAVEAIGFRRVEGDWLGVVITPWFINLFLLPGGGELWADWPGGEQRSVALPAGRMDFIADHPGSGSALPAYQYCPLIAPVQSVADQALAREIAAAALLAALTPAAPAEPPPAGAAMTDDRAAHRSAGSPEDSVAPARRGFLRRLAGRRS